MRTIIQPHTSRIRQLGLHEGVVVGVGVGHGHGALLGLLGLRRHAVDGGLAAPAGVGARRRGLDSWMGYCDDKSILIELVAVEHLNLVTQM